MVVLNHFHGQPRPLVLHFHAEASQLTGKITMALGFEFNVCKTALRPQTH